MWKNLLYLLLTCASAILGLGFLLPDEITARAQVVCGGDPEWVFELAADLEDWSEWSHLNSSLDALATFEARRETGAGQSLRFSGPVLGQGVVEITLFATPVEMGYEQYDNLGEVVARGRMLFEELGGVTRVTLEETQPLTLGPLVRLQAQLSGVDNLRGELKERLSRFERFLVE